MEKDEDIKEIIKAGLNKNKDLLSLRTELVKFKDNGGHREDALKILEELRIEFEGGTDKGDQILELLDFATGWCQDQYKTWA